MAYQFSTGFDFYTSSLQIFDSRQLTTEVISSANARFTGTHSQGVLVNQNGFLKKNLNGNPSRLIVGFALKTSALTTRTVPMRFEDSGTAQVDMSITTAGVIEFYRGDPTTNLIATAGGPAFTASIWHYVEVDVTFATGTGGAVACWLDGTQILNTTGLNTRASANSSANQLTIGEIRNGITSNSFDDLYCLDSSGPTLNARLGERRIITIMPAGPGSFSQYTPVGATPNWNCVKEIPADDDTTYVSDGTAPDRDSYVYEAVSLTGNPDCVIPWGRVRKDDAGTRIVKLSVRNGGVDAYSPTIACAASYAYANGGAFTVNPNGGTAWDQTSINATEFGIETVDLTSETLTDSQTMTDSVAKTLA